MNLRLSEDSQSCEVELFDSDEVELGRQTKEELETKQRPFHVVRGPGGAARRVIVAWHSESADVSRQHARLKGLPGNRVRLTNTSGSYPLRTSRPEGVLQPGESVELHLPFALDLTRRIEVGAASSPQFEPSPDGSLGGAAWRQVLDLGETIAPGNMGTGVVQLPPAADDAVLGEWTGWLRTTLGVLQAAIGSPDFLARATEALVAIVGLRSGWVLLRRKGSWDAEPTARHGDGGESGPWRPSDDFLDALVRERRPVLPDRAEAGATSVFGHISLSDKAVVAAPLLDAENGVIGALYGDLPPAGRGAATSRLPLTALLVEVLACGVSAGLARQRHEREAARLQVQFGQFFTEGLARKLRDRPDLLTGRVETVTVLFCDIRGYSAVAGRLGPQTTEEWLHDVLGALSRCVLDQAGVLVDYVGDELMAMWGAPDEQPDQTERAARAGLAMLRTIPDLNRKWRGELGGDMSVGVGINRGQAQVGNVGSAYKFKYGAIGDTVNVASRVQGMTKHLKCPLLVAESARSHLSGEFAVRRVVLAKLVNIEKPVNLYEVAAAGGARDEFFERSERALDLLERGEHNRPDLAGAGRAAGTLLEKFPDDGPLLLILSRAADALMRDDRAFCRHWVPPGK